MLYKKNNTDLYIFLGICATLTMIGLIFIYSSSSVYALEKYGSHHYFLKKQCLGLLAGLVGLIICRAIPLWLLQKLVPFGFLAALVLTGLTLVPPFALTLNGSHRWLRLGGFVFQPSELLKMAFIAYVAYLIDKKQYRISLFVQGYLPLLMCLGATAAILLKQPDFGQTVTLSLTAFMLFFIAQCNMTHLVSTLGMLIPAGGILIFLKPYRLKRIMTFINPWDDPKGSGFQIIQSLIAIGSGKFSGVGIAHSKQKFFYLPMQCTDFIFSIIAEETGLLGSCFLMSLYIAFLYYGIKLAMQMANPFSFLTTLGFVLLTSLQTIINIFVATGLLPTKGLGLPFISYGNSALICNLCMLGLIINFMAQEK